MTADAESISLAVDFVRGVIGKPWAKSATGPNAYSCWGLAYACQRQVFSRDIPLMAVDEDSPLSVARAMRRHPIWATWEVHDRPLHGDVVKMFRPDNPNHLGVYLDVDYGGILHSVRDFGVCFNNPFLLKNLGWSRLEYWRPGGAA